MNQYRVTACITAAALLAAGMPFAAEASENYELRKRVIRLSGIMSTTNEGDGVTRGEYARMLANASSYRSVALKTSSTAVFSDVPADSEYGWAVKLASENGWMNGYLGGLFKPDQQITLQEAIRGILALLGYTDQDFSGDQINGRWTKYNYLDLGENISKEPLEVLTRRDCVNLFYNLLCAKDTTGKDYCSVLGYELSDDGQVNPLTVSDNDLKGPKVVPRNHRMDDYVPFDLSEATFYLDGQMASLEAVKQAKTYGFVVLYYHVVSKTVWAYSDERTAGSNSGMTAISGEIAGIFYSSNSVMTPNVVTLEGDDREFKLKDSQVQFGFSIYGDMKVGERVILVCEVSGSSDGNMSYTVVDYIEY